MGNPPRDQRKFIGLSYLLALFLGTTFWAKAATDPDLGWHLFGGAWITSHHSLPSFDPVNSLNTSWHNYHWLAQIIFYAIFYAGGYELLRFFSGILLAYLLVVLLDIFYISEGRKKSVLISTVALVISTLLLAHVTSVRPQLLSVLLVAISFRRLLSPQTRYELPLLLLLGCAHVNIHVYWVFTPLLYCLMRVLPNLLRKRAIVREGLGLLLLSLVGLVSPYGVENYALLFDYLTMPAPLRASISELAPGFASSGHVIAILLIYLVLIARLFRLKYALATPGITVSAFIAPLLAIRSIKFLPIFIILGFPFILRHGGVAIRKYAPSIFKRESLPAKISLVLVLSVALAISIKAYPWFDAQLDPIHAKYPLDACRVLGLTELSAHPERDHIRVVTHFNHGGWCRWQLYQTDPSRDFRVTTDGRTQGIPWERFRESFELFRVGPGWQETLDKLDAEAAIVPTNTALAEILPRLQSWNQIYQDKNFLVLIRTR